MHIEHVLAALTLVAASTCADPAPPVAGVSGTVNPAPEPAVAALPGVRTPVDVPREAPATAVATAPEPAAVAVAPVRVDAPILMLATAPGFDVVTLAALARAANGDITALRHPELGVYLIHNMSGVAPELVLRDRWPKRERGWALESRFDSAAILEALAQASTWPALRRRRDPDDPCDKGPSHLRAGSSGALGEVLDIHLGMRERSDETQEQLPPWLERSHAELARAGDRPHFTPARWARLQRLAAAGSHHAYLEHQASIVEFGRIDGRWYLLGIDARDDACG